MGAETRAQNRQNNWQAEQNQLDRDFQQDMVDISADKDYEIWQKQFDLQNQQWYEQAAYNAELQQQQERAKYQILREQGVNPAIAVAHGAGSGMPSVSSPVVASPSGAKMSTGSPSGSPSTAVHSEFQNLADIVQSVVGLTKQGIDATKTFYLLNAELKNRLEESRYRSVLSDYQIMANDVFKEFGRNQKAADLLHTYADALLLNAKGDTERSVQAYNKIKSEYTGILKDIDIKKLPYVESMMIKSLKNLDSIYNLNTASAADARARSEYYGALTLTENDMRQFKVDTEHWNSLLAHNEYVFKDATQMQRFEQYIEQTKQAGILSGEMEQALRLATKNNDWYAVRMLLGIVDTGVKAYGTYKGAKTGEGIVNAQDVRNDIDKRYKDYLQREDDVPSYLKRDLPLSFGYK